MKMTSEAGKLQDPVDKRIQLATIKKKIPNIQGRGDRWPSRGEEQSRERRMKWLNLSD
jgi:hypothetical protein